MVQSSGETLPIFSYSLDSSPTIPQAITTANGKLVITLSEVQNHNLNFMSGSCMKPRVPYQSLTICVQACSQPGINFVSPPAMLRFLSVCLGLLRHLGCGLVRQNTSVRTTKYSLISQLSGLWAIWDAQDTVQQRKVCADTLQCTYCTDSVFRNVAVQLRCM